MKLPGRILWTDGKSDIAVIAGGKENCDVISPSEVALILARTNATRKSRGLPALQLDERLQAAAEAHACDMAARGMMSHVGTDTSGPGPRVKATGYRPRVTAENIGAGRMNAGRISGEWSSSPGHRANILIPGLRDFGVGKAVGSDGKSLFWTAVYAQPI